MPNREVNLTKRINTPSGLRYCRVVLSANGRVKPDVVLGLMGKKNGTRKGPITSNGVKAPRGCACRLVKMQRTQVRDSFAKRQS